MCLRKKKVGQIPGYYSDATAINQASLCARSVDNTGDDGNAIRHLGKKKKKKVQSPPKSRPFYISHQSEFALFTIADDLGSH